MNRIQNIQILLNHTNFQCYNTEFLFLHEIQYSIVCLYLLPFLLLGTTISAQVLFLFQSNLLYIVTTIRMN